MIISFANQKGGVGKTTSCVNLAAALAEKRQKVLLIDCDPQGNSSSGLGVDKKKLETSTYDVLVNGTPIRSVIIKDTKHGFDICPGKIDLVGADVELVEVERREYRLKDALEEIKGEYDLIFIDCPPSLSLLTLNALCASDGIIIPIQAEYYALEGLSQLLETVTAVRENYNEKLRIFGALITMVDGRTQLARQVSDEIRNYFGDKVFRAVIPRNVRLSEAPSHAKTIFEYERWSSGARAYKNVAKECIKRIPKFLSEEKGS